MPRDFIGDVDSVWEAVGAEVSESAQLRLSSGTTASGSPGISGDLDILVGWIFVVVTVVLVREVGVRVMEISTMRRPFGKSSRAGLAISRRARYSLGRALRSRCDRRSQSNSWGHVSSRLSQSRNWSQSRDWCDGRVGLSGSWGESDI